MTAASPTSAALPYRVAPVRRMLFVATILTGSFLLFLVQPMIARMALPQLGGAPNVWNSAMLVYQALLLAGYAYAHRLSRLPLKRQASIHIALLLIAALTLPLTIAHLPPPSPGAEAWWVPLLFFASVGPVFFVVSAQAPLMQRWFALHPAAGEPWALYAASNLGSFAGLIAYPLLAEPYLPVKAQSAVWSAGYLLLIALIGFAARARWQAAAPHEPLVETAPAEPVGARRIALWIVLAAVPSGLLLSTTTHLTTDIVAMPLLWVIPLGIYLLSFVAAFSERRTFADIITLAAPSVMLLAGGLAMSSRSAGTLAPALGSVGLLFVVAVALHSRMYALRPPASQLTLFYLAMSAGGALGGLFAALIAPMVFDWVWEHPLLVLAAALLMPLPAVYDWRRWPGLDPVMDRVGAAVLMAFGLFLAAQLYTVTMSPDAGMMRLWLTLGMAAIGMLLVPWRGLFVSLLLLLMLAQGGLDTITTTLDGLRSRSYFGIYTVRDYPQSNLRTLAHGTTLHGQQSLDPALRREPTSYYGPTSGVAIALGQAQALYGSGARIGVVGLGTGTLACYKQPGENWRFFEIDPEVLRFSRDRTFSFVADCAPDAKVSIGDARIALAGMAPGSLDVLAVDAFSSDAIPLHLLTDEAFGVYLHALAPRGLLIVHISNRFIELEPVIAALARKRGLAVAKRDDNPQDRTTLTPSTWVALSRDPAKVAALAKAQSSAKWAPLLPPAERAWTDDHASILPYIRWENVLRVQ